MLKHKNDVNIPLKSVVLLAFNDREHTAERLLNRELLETGPVEGQRVKALLHRRKISPKGEQNVYGEPAEPDKDGMVFETVRGNSRAFTLAYMGKQGIEDPLTRRKDEKTGEGLVNTGKPFSTIHADVIEGATEDEILSLMNDNTGIKLTELEIVRSVMREEARQRNERRTLLNKYGLLLQAFPAQGQALVDQNAKIATLAPDVSEAKKSEFIRDLNIARWHGKFLLWRAAYNSATVVKTAYENRLRGKQNWPSDADIKKLYTLYNEDMADRGPGGENAKGTINPDNPGKRFNEKWAEIMRAVELARANGDETKVKSTAARGQEQLRQAMSKVKVRSINLTLFFALNKMEGDEFDDFCDVQQAFEEGKMDAAAYSKAIDGFYEAISAREPKEDNKKDAA